MNSLVDIFNLHVAILEEPFYRNNGDLKLTRLQLSTFVPGPVEEVYKFVTSYSSAGVVNTGVFTQKHGNIVKSEGNIIVTKDSQAGYDLTWRCTFEYPNRRLMEAVDSGWADRTDIFKVTTMGTNWEIAFETKRRGPIGGVQALFFYLFTKKRIYNTSIDPVVQHFRKINYP